MDGIEELLAGLDPQQRQALLDQLEAADAPPGPGPAGGPAPLSPGQRRLWFLHRLEPGNPAYHICHQVDWPGELDTSALATALGDLAERHEALRTRYTAEGEDLRPVVDPPAAVPVRTVDLTALPAAEAERELAATARAEADLPFDLENGPVLRATAVLLPGGAARIVLAQHHINSDGWSVDVLLDELWQAYRARSAGRAPRFAGQPGQYREFAAWQQERAEFGAVAADLAWWRSELADGVEPLELPADRPRAAGRGRGAVLRRTLPADLTAALEALGRSAGGTLFMTALAGFQALLHRWTGSPRIPVAVPVSGRSRPEFESAAGFFLNTLPLQADLSADPAFTDLLGQVRDRVLGAFEHQEAPFERLVEELAPGRGGRSPLTPVLFAFNAHPAGDEPGPLRARTTEVDTSGARAELCVVLEAGTAGGLRIAYEYDRDLFEQATVERLHGHLTRLLAGAAADPALPVSRLPLLTGEEERQLAGWNATGLELPAVATVADLVAQQAERTPDAVALVLGGEQVGYRELDRRANRLAHRLVGLGVGPGDRVGVLLERSPALVTALVAVLRAGAAYVPLDPSYPADRLGYVLADAEVSVLIGTAELAGRLEGPLPALVEPGEDAGFPDTAPEVARDGADPAYVLYTSGSTGRPKGVVNTHAGLLNHTVWLRDAFVVDGRDRVLQKTPIGFDVSLWELLVPLTAGAALVLAEPDGHRDPRYLAEVIERERITVVHFVPSMLQVFLDGAEPGALRGVRQVLCSGETLPGELVRRCRAAGITAPIDNLYGPTEAAVHVTRWTCTPEDTAGVPIGHPVANTQLHVLDAHGSPVPVGRPGELYLGGVQVAAGYWGRPDLTEERFLPDPFSADPAARLYRTGDLVRRRPDGALEHLGRLDHQVKLRGLRIELGEIEAVLTGHPAVAEAAVLLREDTPGEPRLVAYWVPAADGPGEAAEDEVRAHTARLLPGYMVPAVFAALAAVPLSANGKTDRRALAAAPAPAVRTAGYEAPRDEVEQTLAGLYGELLGRERVGIRDDFFDLGGHSLLATRLAARIRRDFGVDLPLRDLFDAPTVEALAVRVVEAVLGGLDEDQLDAVLSADTDRTPGT
ncbi:non-ribosomal peptide synthetase [Streptomyces sp. NRRL B-24484]|uniref:non-ribosomal peptide synthetase n=1 Tax=Streptomyces sp. NRRL B-24484 TaxID=1463833 RepID=UPI000693FAC3|nr:non-ribosomal peptide synthetase [Streptomyces sp. NRRL B-24484]